MTVFQRSLRLILTFCLLMGVTIAIAACQTTADSADGSDTETTVSTQETTAQETESETETQPAEDDNLYRVELVDGLGNPITDSIIVRIKKGDDQITMVRYTGEALTFRLDTGNTYDVVLELMGLDYTYDQSTAVLTDDSKSLTVQLFSSVEEETLSLYVNAPVDAEYSAIRVTEGTARVELTPNDYSFFVFTPTTSAIFAVEYVCDEELSVSYHGSTFFTQGTDISKNNDEMAPYGNGLAIHVYPGNLGTNYVIGIRSQGATACTLSIKYVGDVGTRVEDQPWVPFTEDPAKVTEHLAFTAEGTYTPIDVTDPTLVAVLNENDGYYHLGTADGPVLFITLTEGNRFISSITAICQKQGMGVYIYDEQGTVIEKRSYTDLFLQYGLVIEEGKDIGNITVPLTAKLAEAVQVFGDRMGWWKENASTNIFYNGENALLPGEVLNTEYAWLLFCGYYA